MRTVASGVLQLEPEIGFANRMAKLSVLLNDIIVQENPRVGVVERIFLGKNADSAFKLGHARGVVLAELAKKKIEVVEYSTREVKKGITGNGNSQKEQVQFVLKALLGMQNFSRLDESDALALAVFHFIKADVANRVTFMGVNNL